MMHGNAQQLRDAPAIDARSLRVECPEHKGLLLPVTTVKIGRHHASSPQDVRTVSLYLEALCVYCDQYHYVKVEEGSIAGLPVLPWHE
jgi:hypothetical protein